VYCTIYPMEQKLIVVFGKPGAGKSYVADIIADRFGYYPYNGDEALPSDMKKKILEKSDVTTDMRERFVENMIMEMKRLQKTRGKIVLHQALIKEHMRETLLQQYHEALFLWVDCDHDILKKRYMKRKYFNLGLGYLQVMIDAFEEPQHIHTKIENTHDGPEKILKQLGEVLL
jgi:gluconate kinase